MPATRPSRIPGKKSVHARNVIRKYHGDLGVDKLESQFNIVEGRLRYRLDNAQQVPPGERIAEFAEHLGIPLPELTAGFMRDAGVVFAPEGVSDAEARVLDAVRGVWANVGDVTHDDLVKWINVLASLGADDRQACLAMAERLPRQRRTNWTATP